MAIIDTVQIIEQSLIEAEEEIKSMGANLPKKASKTTLEEVSDFPEDMTELNDKTLMSFWEKNSRVEEYLEYLFVRQSLFCKYLESHIKDLWNVLYRNSTGKNKELREIDVEINEEYKELRKSLIDQETRRDLLKVSLDTYQKRNALCSRDLTRRTGTHELKYLRAGMNRAL